LHVLKKSISTIIG